jgi:hypothetical protein
MQDAIATFLAFRGEMREWTVTTRRMNHRAFRGEITQEEFLTNRCAALQEIFDRYVVYRGEPMRFTATGASCGIIWTTSTNVTT